MRKKLFISILFQNRRLMFVYFLLLFAAVYFVLVQLNVFLLETDTLKNPNPDKVEDIFLALSVNFLVLGSLLLYLIKGMEKKVGILKALGIPDRYVVSTFCIGFGVFLKAVCLSGLVMAMLTVNLAVLPGLVCTMSIGAVMLAVSIFCCKIAYQSMGPGF